MKCILPQRDRRFPVVFSLLVAMVTAYPAFSLRAQSVGPLPKAPDPKTEMLLKAMFKGADQYFSVEELWVQPVAQMIPEEDLRQLIFSLKASEKQDLANNIIKAGVAGFRPKKNHPGMTATITFYELADKAKAPVMLKGMTSILNANRNALDSRPGLKILDYQGSQPKDDTFSSLSYHTYSIQQKTDAKELVEKFQVLRAASGNLFLDAIVMNGNIPKEKLLGALKTILKNWKGEQKSQTNQFQPSIGKDNGEGKKDDAGK